jgi:sugar phosphate isomerase/epimerase
MHLGVFAKTFPRPTLEETLDTIVDHGLWHVQFNMSCAGLPTLPERPDEKLCRWIAQLLRERGMTMAAISGTFNLCDPDESRLKDNLQRLDGLAVSCRWLDTRIITVCTGTRDANDMWKWHPENVRRSSWETLVQSMRQAVQIADRNEVTLAFEPEMHNIVNSVAKARRLLDEIGSPWLKVVIDPANLIPSGDMSRMSETFNETFDWLGPDIVLAHAKDPDSDVDLEALMELEDRMATGFWNLPKHPSTLSEVLIMMLNELTSTRVRDLFLFYLLYFRWLKRIEFTAPVIMHGLHENRVGKMQEFLTRQLLRRDPQ